MAFVNAGLQIEEIIEVRDDVLLAMVRLVKQLSGSAVPPGRAELEEITRSSASRLLIARGQMLRSRSGQCRRGRPATAT
jgi:hypothetical protein